MDSFKSDVVTINANIDTVFNKLANPESLKNIQNLGSMPTDMKEKVEQISFDKDSISIKANPVGEIKLTIVERIEPNKLVYSATGSPVPLKAVISLTKVSDYETSGVAELQIELNPFLRTMASKPLTEGAKKFGELLAVLPYNAL